jgi:hypothetical protein
MTPQAVVRHLTYGLIFARPEDNAQTAQRYARLILDRRVLTAGPQVYYDGVRATLDSAEPIENVHGVPHTDAELRDFFRLLTARLDELRPWPDEPKT